MTLESQVCSLSLAQRLKELGVKQESLFAHYKNDDGYQFIGDEWHVNKADTSNHRVCSAFTVAELGEMLPRTLGKNLDIEMYVYDQPRRYGLQYSDYVGQIPRVVFSVLEATEADARAKMLIYLLENKLVELN